MIAVRITGGVVPLLRQGGAGREAESARRSARAVHADSRLSREETRRASMKFSENTELITGGATGIGLMA
jgi:hypothetical protein